MAEAVIKGWPEAPSSPLQGGAPSGPGAACTGADFCPENRLPRKFETPLPPGDCPRAGAENTTAAATKIAPVRLLIADAVQRMSCLSAAGTVSEGLVTVSNSLTKARFCCFRRLPQGAGGPAGSSHPPLLPAANRLPTCDQGVFDRPSLSRLSIQGSP